VVLRGALFVFFVFLLLLLLLLLFFFRDSHYQVGHYDEASLLLRHFRALNTDAAKEMSALWGKLCADIVSAKWTEAAKGLTQLKV
jgi:hypothetical protein